jgi:hypothetical protein
MRDDVFTAFLFLGAFPKMRKTTIWFVMSVCLSVRMEQLGTHSKNFHKFSQLYRAYWLIQSFITSTSAQ